MEIAIYSRKSKYTDKGESTHNQIEMCKEYAEKHYSNPEYTIYEDEGFSGGDTNRSSFQQMLEDARGKKFEVLICYRLDRVSRNIADFSALIEELQKHDIAFVSIREQFDTSTPMGRAMMFIASVFAQLERETIGERIRDNMHELAKTGRWLGGAPPFGFEAERISFIDEEHKERSLVKLNPVPEKMETVKLFYEKYLELGSIHKVRKHLVQNNIKGKKGAHFSNRGISEALRSPAFVQANQDVVEYLQKKGIIVAGQDRINGKLAILTYNKRNKKGIKNEPGEWIGAVAKHEGIISPEIWLQVQEKMDKNSMTLPREGTSEVALLSGILRCAECGAAMNVTYGRKRKDGSCNHYYTCSMKIISGQEHCQNPNANGIDIDHTVISRLTDLATSSESTDALLSELDALRQEKKHQGRADILDELKKKKQRLLSEINNLVGEVSKSSAASKYILPQIEAKDREVKELGEEIAGLEKEKEKQDKESEGFSLVVNNILNFSSTIAGLENKEKKFFLQTIIDKAYWDGESGEVSIALLTDTAAGKKKLNCNSGSDPSQFHLSPSWPRNESAIILYGNANSAHRYEDYPEDTLGHKLRKQRFLKELTAAELAEMCGLKKETIYTSECGATYPHYATIEKICKVLEIPVSYFEDDYFTFVLSEGYEESLKQWRKNNTGRYGDVKRLLGVSYESYLNWEKGEKMSRAKFELIRDRLGV